MFVFPGSVDESVSKETQNPGSPCLQPILLCYKILLPFSTEQAHFVVEIENLLMSPNHISVNTELGGPVGKGSS